MARKTSLTDAQIDQIIELGALRANGKRLSAGAVARRLGVSKQAVAWQMYRNGLKDKNNRTVPQYFRADGTIVRSFQEDEDTFIQAARQEGKGYSDIASAVQARFGYERRPSAIKVRLIMLAGFEEAEEERKLAA